jgi:hypothetical protein
MQQTPRSTLIVVTLSLPAGSGNSFGWRAEELEHYPDNLYGTSQVLEDLF